MTRALVTGAAGFIGSHLVEYLLRETDWQVVCLDRLDPAASLHRLAHLFAPRWVGRMDIVWHDLKAPINDATAARLGAIDYVFHLAANSSVERSLSNPAACVMDTVLGTAHLLDWAVSQVHVIGSDERRPLVFNFGTDEVFGPAPDDVRFTEDDGWHPSNPYAASKCGQAALGMAYHRSYGLPVITTYTMNNFGERQHPEKLIPKTMRALLRDEPMPIHCRLSPEGSVIEIGQRTWLHARNTCSALLYLVAHGVPGEAYNIAGDAELDNQQLALHISHLMRRYLRVEYVDFHAARPGHDRRYALDGTKLAKLGWTPPVTFEDSLRRTVEWTIDHPEWLDG